MLQGVWLLWFSRVYQNLMIFSVVQDGERLGILTSVTIHPKIQRLVLLIYR